MSPETVQYAMARQKALRGKSFTAAEVQDIIKLSNQTNKAFYANPMPEMAGRAYVDSMIANNLRAGLDSAIESATGVAYAPLKRKYGALRMLETDVTKRAIVDARKNIKGLIDFSDIFSGQQVVQGLIMRDPVMITSGGVVRGISSYIKYINDPNRIVRSMFKKVEKQTRKGKPSMGRSAAGMAAGAVAGQDEYRLYQ